jgi:hypothetical protein
MGSTDFVSFTGESEMTGTNPIRIFRKSDVEKGTSLWSNVVKDDFL